MKFISAFRLLLVTILIVPATSVYIAPRRIDASNLGSENVIGMWLRCTGELCMICQLRVDAERKHGCDGHQHDRIYDRHERLPVVRQHSLKSGAAKNGAAALICRRYRRWWGGW